MLRQTAPCKDCKDRCVGCHGKCEAYIAFKHAREKENVTVHKKKRTDAYTFVAIERMKKRNRSNHTKLQ